LKLSVSLKAKNLIGIKKIYTTHTQRGIGGERERERTRGMESQSSNKATRQAKERKRQKDNPEKEMIVQ